MPLGAARYQQRARFERQPKIEPDASGTARPDRWTNLDTVWAHLRPQYGRETLEAGRLESTTRAVLTIRRTAFAKALTADDRVVTLRAPFDQWVWAIRTITPTADNRELELTIEHNVAT